VIYTWLGVARTDSMVIASYNDLFMHFAGYIILMNSCLLAYGARPRKAVMFGLLLLYSFMIEVIQYFLPYREFSLLDLLANSLGLITGQILGLTAARLLERFNMQAAPAGDNNDPPAQS
jgi:VanZ family protein